MGARLAWEGMHGVVAYWRPRAFIGKSASEAINGKSLDLMIR